MIEVLALMGYSTFELYMEDTYQIEDNLTFGYFRGAYSAEELQKSATPAVDMTLVPHIKLSAHKPLSNGRQKCKAPRCKRDVLLIGEEKSLRPD